uniref:Uncharacterized protein n=1 Tax=Ciona intestinalis TaxID=7719 RepID=H2Y330_CIOIN
MRTKCRSLKAGKSLVLSDIDKQTYSLDRNPHTPTYKLCSAKVICCYTFKLYIL